MTTKITDKMKTALAKCLAAHSEGRSFGPRITNGHTFRSLERHGLVEYNCDGWMLTPAGVEVAERLADEQWGIGGDWIPTGETLDEIIDRDLSHRK